MNEQLHASPGVRPNDTNLTPFTPRPNFFVVAGNGLQVTFTFANDDWPLR